MREAKEGARLQFSSDDIDKKYLLTFPWLNIGTVCYSEQLPLYFA